MSAHIEIYREDRSGITVPAPYRREDYEPKPVWGKWRWRFIKNGRTMAHSGQGYSRRVDCLNACATVLGGWVDTTNCHVMRLTDRYDDRVVTDAVEIRDLTRKER